MWCLNPLMSFGNLLVIWSNVVRRSFRISSVLSRVTLCQFLSNSPAFVLKKTPKWMSRLWKPNLKGKTSRKGLLKDIFSSAAFQLTKELNRDGWSRNRFPKFDLIVNLWLHQCPKTRTREIQRQNSVSVRSIYRRENFMTDGTCRDHDLATEHCKIILQFQLFTRSLIVCTIQLFVIISISPYIVWI